MTFLKTYHLVAWRIHAFLDTQLHDQMNDWRTCTILMLLQEIFFIGLMFIFESPSEANYISNHLHALFLATSVVLVVLNMYLYYNQELRHRFRFEFRSLSKESISRINKLLVGGIIFDGAFVVFSFFWSVSQLAGK